MADRKATRKQTMARVVALTVAAVMGISVILMAVVR